MVTPQAEAVLAGSGFPDVLHKVTARRHFRALGVQSNGLEHCERLIRCEFILGPALCCGLTGGAEMSSRSTPWKADHCPIRDELEMCALAIRAHCENGDQEEGRKEGKVAKEGSPFIMGPVLSCQKL